MPVFLRQINPEMTFMTDWCRWNSSTSIFCWLSLRVYLSQLMRVNLMKLKAVYWLQLAQLFNTPNHNASSRATASMPCTCDSTKTSESHDKRPNECLSDSAYFSYKIFICRRTTFPLSSSLKHDPSSSLVSWMLWQKNRLTNTVHRMFPSPWEEEQWVTTDIEFRGSYGWGWITISKW